MGFLREKSDPRDFCALISLSNSSKTNGTNLKDRVIIIAILCEEIPTTFKGERRNSNPLVNFWGEVVRVRREATSIRKISLKVMKVPKDKPCSVIFSGPKEAIVLPGVKSRWRKKVNTIIQSKGNSPLRTNLMESRAKRMTASKNMARKE
jgi:hypothetical protein